jgi:hypothetical protein
MTSPLSHLLARGYFPKELPPPFNTKSFGTFAETAPAALPPGHHQEGEQEQPDHALGGTQLGSHRYVAAKADHPQPRQPVSDRARRCRRLGRTEIRLREVAVFADHAALPETWRPRHQCQAPVRCDPRRAGALAHCIPLPARDRPESVLPEHLHPFDSVGTAHEERGKGQAERLLVARQRVGLGDAQWAGQADHRHPYRPGYLACHRRGHPCRRSMCSSRGRSRSGAFATSTTLPVAFGRLPRPRKHWGYCSTWSATCNCN